ncbi:MAG: hypothetical protein E7511_03910 [Ruminococcus sp.]|nr:hypothetical protein [Ruminococcus sp.]
MYLSRGHMIYTAAMAVMQLLLGVPFLMLMLFLLVVKPSALLDDPDSSVPFLLEFGFLSFLGLRNACHFFHAQRFNTCFLQAGYSSLTVADAAQRMGISHSACRRRFDTLTRYGLLKHCHPEYETTARIVLHRKQTDDCRGAMTIFLQMLSFFGLGISGALLFLFVFGVLHDLISGDMSHLKIGFGGLLLFTLLALGSLKLRQIVGRAYRFSNYFSGNAGRPVPAMQMARAFSMTETAVMDEFFKLSKLGLLTGWHGQTAPMLRFLPHYPAVNAPEPAAPMQNAVYVALNCPNCGASLSLEQGRRTQCPYCDSWLSLSE